LTCQRTGCGYSCRHGLPLTTYEKVPGDKARRGPVEDKIVTIPTLIVGDEAIVHTFEVQRDRLSLAEVVKLSTDEIQTSVIHRSERGPWRWRKVQRCTKGYLRTGSECRCDNRHICSAAEMNREI